MRYLFILLFGVLFLINPKISFSQDVSISISSNQSGPSIPPYISDWEKQVDLFIIDVSTNLPNPINAIIRIELTENNAGLIASGENAPIQIQGGSSNFSIRNSDFMNWSTWNYDQSMKDDVIRQRKLPDGVYNLCTYIHDADNNDLVQENCFLFEVFLPESPVLIAPVGNEEIMISSPSFSWSPVILPGKDVVYNLKVFEVLDDQDPNQAVLSNQVHFEKSIEGLNNYFYQETDQAFEIGRTYAWFVQALDLEGFPAGNNDGMSQVESFTVTDGNTTVVLTWEDSVKMFTEDGALDNVTLKKNPCPKLKELIASLQAKLKKARSDYQKGEAKKTKGDAMVKNGNKMIDEADGELPDLEKDLKFEKGQRNALINGLMSKTGSSMSKAGEDCGSESYAAVKSGNKGTYEFIQPGKQLCIPGNQVNNWIGGMAEIRDQIDAFNESIKDLKSKISAQKSKKEQGEKDVKDGKQKSEEGAAEMKKAKAEVEKLEAALKALEPVAKECGEIIKSLKEAADKSRSAITDATRKTQNGKSSNHGNESGDKSSQELDEADKDLAEAEKLFEAGDYEAATAAANAAGSHAGNSAKARAQQDCIKKAKAKLEKAKKDLKSKQEKFPDTDMSAQAGALNRSQAEIDKAEEALGRGDYEAAARHCKKAMDIIDEDFYPPLNAIVCNDGDERGPEWHYVTEVCAGWFLAPTQLEPDNAAFRLMQWMEMAAFTKAADIAEYVKNFYKLSSLGHAYDLYMIRAKRYAWVKWICKNGVWQTSMVPGSRSKSELYMEKVLEIASWGEIKKQFARNPECGSSVNDLKQSFDGIIIEGIVDVMYEKKTYRVKE